MRSHPCTGMLIAMAFLECEFSDIIANFIFLGFKLLRLDWLMSRQGFSKLFSVKGQTVNIVGFTGLMVSVEITSLCCFSIKQP